MSTCFDEPGLIFDSNRCVDAVSKDVQGKVGVPKPLRTKCDTKKCEALHTLGPLSALATINKPCDSRISRPLDGKFIVRKLATIYDTDGLGRGVHAGDFEWTGVNGKGKIAGRMSGITNAGILRAQPFKECEECSQPGIMIGRLCGVFVEPHTARLKGAQFVAVYRFEVGKVTKDGASGPVKGTIEGAIIELC